MDWPRTLQPFQVTEETLYASTGSTQQTMEMETEEVKSSSPAYVSQITSTVFWVDCPHCHEPFELSSEDLNCCIFRHGWFVENGNPIPPHATKQQCDHWVTTREVFGCGKPFRYNKDTNTTEVCDYI